MTREARRRMHQVLLSLVIVGLARATVFAAVAAEPNACIQTDYRPRLLAYLPALPAQLPADPNLAVGPVLGPAPGDPNAWSVPAGPYKRNYARACDPEGDEFTIRYVRGTSAAEPQLDRASGKWTFSAVAVAGLNAWQFETDDGKDQRLIWIMAWGLSNEPPVLE